MDWLLTNGWPVLMVVISAIVTYGAVILFTRLTGLRSFSEMSAFDFAVTIAVGSVIANIIVLKNPPLLLGLVGLATLFLVEGMVGRLRRCWPRFKRTVDTPPLLLMAGPDILWRNLRYADMTEEDLWAQLRQANVLDLSHVRAVVLETTGNVTVLQSPFQEHQLDPKLITGVRDRRQLDEGAQSDRPDESGKAS